MCIPYKLKIYRNLVFRVLGPESNTRKISNMYRSYLAKFSVIYKTRATNLYKSQKAKEIL